MCMTTSEFDMGRDRRKFEVVAVSQTNRSTPHRYHLQKNDIGAYVQLFVKRCCIHVSLSIIIPYPKLCYVACFVHTACIYYQSAVACT